MAQIVVRRDTTSNSETLRYRHLFTRNLMPKRSRTPTLRYTSHTDGGHSSTAEIFTYTL
jgi:hypothetical protein